MTYEEKELILTWLGKTIEDNQWIKRKDGFYDDIDEYDPDIDESLWLEIFRYMTEDEQRTYMDHLLCLKPNDQDSLWFVHTARLRDRCWALLELLNKR